jgi:hypothetical protein
MIVQNIKLGMYQRWLKDKYRVIETIYYQHVDELTQYIADLDLPGVKHKDFTLTEYSFIKEWEKGMISSAKVYSIMQMANIEQAAKAKITKPLENYMFTYDILTEHIKPTIAKLDAECVDLMIEYLTMMKRTFKKMAELDREQIKVTWLQQFFRKNKADEILTQEMPLNQTIHHLATYVYPTSGQRFHLGDQIVVFDEEIGEEDRAIHWIFAPRQYIELLRVLFNIKEDLGKDEIEFLRNLIRDVE